jgi:predicted CXXCH cytochrome family protein
VVFINIAKTGREDLLKNVLMFFNMNTMAKDRSVPYGKHIVLSVIAVAALALCGVMPATAEEVDCSMCHLDLAKKKVVHAAVSMGCPTCHTSLNATEVPHKVTGNVPKGLSSPVPDLCFTCHDKTKFNNKAVHPPVAGGMCTSCHNPHSSDNAKLLIAEVPALCTNCHDRAMFSKKNVHAPVAGGMCLSCHGPHATDEMALLTKRPTAVCLECHPDIPKKAHVTVEFRHPLGSTAKPADKGPEKKSAKKERSILMDPARPGKEFYCGSCHEPHSSEGNRLIRFPVKSYFDLCVNCHKK